MNSVVILILGLIVVIIGYYGYANYFSKRVIIEEPKKATPAKMFMDGVDFIPTNRNVLFGFQFKSIAGAAPILGPIIALQWGWLPGLIWLLVGVLFIGWIQDYTSTMICVRSEGKTFGGLSFELISPRARSILLIFIYFYLLLIAAAFGDAVAKQLSKQAFLPVSMIALAGVGILVGFLIYKTKAGLLPVTIIGLGIMAGAVVAGKYILIGADPNLPADQLKSAQYTFYIIWIVFALLFSYLGAVLPIWQFAQPINYISFFIIFGGIIAGAIGILVGHPKMSLPPFEGFGSSLGPLWPILFVTIACGAISGWHSLVSSSGTARQLESECDARPVCAGAMFSEMILALVAIIAVSATMQNKAEYLAIMKDKVAGGPGVAFSQGFGNMLGFLHIPGDYARLFSGLMICVLALTVLQIVVRFMRLATNELLGRSVPILRNPHIGTFVALVFTFVLIVTGSFNYIWVLFGGANQLMASLALLLGTLWLASNKKNFHYTFWPMIFMAVTTVAALGYMSVKLFRQAFAAPQAGAAMQISQRVGNFISGFIGAALIILALILFFDAISAFLRILKARKKEAVA